MDTADGYAERRAALEMLDNNVPGVRRITVAGDKGYDTSDFVEELVHVALAVLSNLTDPSAIASPQVRYSVASNALIICGAFVPMGARPGAGASGPTSPSEFGLYPYLYHVDLKVYM